MKAGVMHFSIVGLCLFFFLSGCAEDSSTFGGTISYEYGFRQEDGYPITAAYCYVFLDDDTDISNGYIKREIIDIPALCYSIKYTIDTSDVPEGVYYLRAAYDFEVDHDGNTDPENPSVWEAAGWWGGTGSNPPAAANVTDMIGTYDILLVGLG